MAKFVLFSFYFFLLICRFADWLHFSMFKRQDNKWLLKNIVESSNLAISTVNILLTDVF